MSAAESKDEPPVLPGLRGRTIVVVGAGGGGIGSATCDVLGDSGARIIAVDLAADRAGRLMENLGQRGVDVVPVVADVTSSEGLDSVMAAIEAEATPPAGLVNVIGGATERDWGHFLELTSEQWERSLSLNLTHVFRIGQLAGRALAATGSGSIVNLSAIVGLTAAPWWAPYGATRAATLALTKTMAVELGPLGVRVNAVVPGIVNTPRAHGGPPDVAREQSVIPLGRRGDVREVATVVAFLLSDLSSYVTAQTIVVDGGMSARSVFYGQGNVPLFLESEQVRREMSAALQRLGYPDG